MPKFHLWPEDPRRIEDVFELAATLEISSQERLRLWFRLPTAWSPAVSTNLDSFTLAVLFNAMAAGADLEIHGEVSPSLLSNLVEFQKAWSLWLPAKYHPIDIFAGTERDLPRSRGNDVIMGFSGGVDSSFTAWQHRPDNKNNHRRKLAAGIMMHGFDIPIDQPGVFASAAGKARKMLASIETELIPVSTNLRDQRSDWEDSHGAALAACLMLFQGRFNTGLIASSDTYSGIDLPWGSNPVTDRLLSNDSFQVIHDGAGSNRVDKIRQISRWPEARQYLRVCWVGRDKDRNCCRCIKCVGAMLLFRAVSQEPLPAFPFDISDRDIRHMRFNDLPAIRRYIKLLHAENSSSATLRSLKIAVLINRVRLAGDRFSITKNLFRGLGNRWYLDLDRAGRPVIS